MASSSCSFFSITATSSCSDQLRSCWSFLRVSKKSSSSLIRSQSELLRYEPSSAVCGRKRHSRPVQYTQLFTAFAHCHALKRKSWENMMGNFSGYRPPGNMSRATQDQHFTIVQRLRRQFEVSQNTGLAELQSPKLKSISTAASVEQHPHDVHTTIKASI